MAYLKLSPKTLYLTVELGCLEKYEPDNNIKEISKEAEKLRDLTTNKMKELFGNADVAQAKEKLSNNKQLKDKWDIFLEKQYDPKLTKLKQKIHNKNKEICPGYMEALERIKKNEEEK